MSIFRSISGFFASKGDEPSAAGPPPHVAESDRASISESDSLTGMVDTSSVVSGTGETAAPGILSRRTSSASIKSLSLSLIGPDIEPPEVDLSHLNEDEQAQIAAVIARARKQMQIEDEPQEMPKSVSSVEEFPGSTSADDDKVERLCALCGNFIDAEDAPSKLCATCQRPACAECGSQILGSTSQVMEWVCQDCQPSNELPEPTEERKEDVINSDCHSSPQSEVQHTMEFINKPEEIGDQGGEEESDECHTAENFFRSFLKNPFSAEVTSEPEQEEASDELGNGGQTRPQNLELGSQSAAPESKISPGDEVWLKFMGEILQPSQDPPSEESVVPASISRPFEEERSVPSSVLGSEAAQPTKFSGSLSRSKPSPLERISHGDHQIQTSSRCSPKSPPSSPSWARYRESPTRSPVSRTRSPQMSPCEKHSAKMIEGMAAIADFREPTLAALEFSGSPPAEPNVSGGIDVGSLEDSELDSCIDLASFAATVVSSTAYLMGMSISPPEYVPEVREDAATTIPATSAEKGEPENNEQSSVSEERQLELALEQIQQNLTSHLLSSAQDDWSPLRDLYPIVDIASSLEWLERDKLFTAENEAERNETATEPEDVEQLEDISENIAALKTSGILTPLKRCPSFSNIPSLTSALEEQMAVVSSSPVEFKELHICEEKDNAEQQQHVASDFEEIFKSAVAKPDVISIVTLADKEFDDFDCHHNQGNFLEIEDNYDLYSASSSPEVPSDSYNSIKMNSNDHLAVGIDEQNFILSSDDDQEIDLDEDIPPKHLIGTRRSKDFREQSIVSGFGGEEVNFPSSKDGPIDEEKSPEALEFKCSTKTTEDVPDVECNEVAAEESITQTDAKLMKSVSFEAEEEDVRMESTPSKKMPPPRPPPPVKVPSLAAKDEDRTSGDLLFSPKSGLDQAELDALQENVQSLLLVDDEKVTDGGGELGALVEEPLPQVEQMVATTAVVESASEMQVHQTVSPVDSAQIGAETGIAAQSVIPEKSSNVLDQGTCKTESVDGPSKSKPSAHVLAECPSSSLIGESFSVVDAGSSKSRDDVTPLEPETGKKTRPVVPPKPPRPQRRASDSEDTTEVHGLKVPVKAHSLKQRVKEELKIVTAARRLRIDEAEEVRIMEAELEERKRERRMKVRDLVAADKSSSRHPSLPGDEYFHNKSSTLGDRNIGMTADMDAFHNAARSSSTLYHFHSGRHVRQPSDPFQQGFSSFRDEVSTTPRRCSQNDKRQSRNLWGSSTRSVQDLDYSSADDPIAFNTCLSRSSNILDDYSDEFDLALPNSHSESALPLNFEPDEWSASKDLLEKHHKEEKLLKLQMEIEKRRQHLYKLERSQLDWESPDENSPRLTNLTSLPSRQQQEPSQGVIKPIDYQIDPEKYILRDKTHDWMAQEVAKKKNLDAYLEPVYSSFEYLAHKSGRHNHQFEEKRNEFDLSDAFTQLPALSQYDLEDRVTFADDSQLLFAHSSFPDGVESDNFMGGRTDLFAPCQQPIAPYVPFVDIPAPSSICHQDYDVVRRDLTPAMSLLDDVTSRTRNILRDIGSRPLSDDMEKYFQVEEPLNLMFRDESEYSISESADDNVMEGGITIRMLSNYKHQLSSSLNLNQKYKFDTKRILLTPDPKDKSFRENGIGLKIVGGKLLPWTDEELGAYVAAIYPGTIADQLHGELNEGDQVLEWNGEPLTGKTYDEVQQIISNPNCEVELVIRPGTNLWARQSSTMSTLHTMSDSNRSSYENVQISEISTDGLSGATSIETQRISDPDVLVSHLGLGTSTTESAKDDIQRRLSQEESSSPTSNLAVSKYGHQRMPLSARGQSNQFYVDSLQGSRSSGHPQVYLGEIQLQLNYDDYTGALNIHVIEARDLLPLCKSGLADPLVKVTLLPSRSSHDCKKTKQALRTLSPKWHQKLTFPNISVQDLSVLKLEASVWDRDNYLPDQFMGEVVIDFSVNRCLDNRLRWYHLNEYSPKNFDQTTPAAHAMSSSESGSSAASQPVPRKSADSIVETQNESHRNPTQSPVTQDLPPQTLVVESAASLASQQRSVEGGPPVLSEPLDAEPEPGQNQRSSSRESLDMSGQFEKDDGHSERLLKERTNSELVGLLPERSLAPEDQASNSRSNVSTPIDAIFEEARCHMEERRSPDGHDNKFTSSSVLANSLHGILTSLSCCVRPVSNNSHQENVHSSGRILSR